MAQSAKTSRQKNPFFFVGPSLHSALPRKSHYSGKPRALQKLPAACRLSASLQRRGNFVVKTVLPGTKRAISSYMLALPSERKLHIKRLAPELHINTVFSVQYYNVLQRLC
jgi:hypothetical protein